MNPYFAYEGSGFDRALGDRFASRGRRFRTDGPPPWVHMSGRHEHDHDHPRPDDGHDHSGPSVGRRDARGTGPGGGRFGGRFGRGPRAGRGDVRAAILSLLGESPMHGYQIMQELNERSGGAWKPSPGSVYPTLQALEDEELIVAEAKSAKRTFTLTNAGHEVLNAHPEYSGWLETLNEGDHGLLELGDLMRQVGGATRQVIHAGSPRQIAAAKGLLADVRRALYHVLAEDDELVSPPTRPAPSNKDDAEPGETQSA